MGRNIRRVLGACVLVSLWTMLALVSQAGALTAVDMQHRPSHQEKHAMAVKPVKTAALPPIDVAQPDTYETATFALG